MEARYGTEVDVAPVPGIVQAMLIGCYPGSGYQRVRGRRTSLPTGKGRVAYRAPSWRASWFPREGLSCSMEPLSHGPSRLLALGALYPHQSIIGFSLPLRTPFPFFLGHGRQGWPRTAELAADGRACSDRGGLLFQQRQIHDTYCHPATLSVCPPPLASIPSCTRTLTGCEHTRSAGRL